jgi:ATP-dependent Lon protease
MTSFSNRGGAPMPKEPLAALPLRSGVLFPGASLTLSVGRPRSLALLRSVYPGDVIVTLTQKAPKTHDPSRDDLYDAATLARVESIQKRTETDWQLTVTGLDRASLVSLHDDGPFLRALVEKKDEVGGASAEAQELAAALVRKLRDTTESEGGALSQLDVRGLEPGALADAVAAQSNVPTEREVAILAELDVPARLRLLTDALGELRARGELKTKIDSEVRQRFGKIQREAVLREQLRAIQKELGDDDDGDDSLGALRKRLDEAQLPEEARKVADRELARLSQAGAQGAEANVIRTYLELIADLPWSKRADAKNDVAAVEAELDRDHFGLDDVKKRILEHMAVLGLSAEQKGALLCLVGPPGVGKTSLGESIAKATGRPFVRVALGGVRDEAEIRGHRRTYIGAMPGKIIQALKKAGSSNPVVLLDEIDKMSTDFRGDPSSALLEVLDPEQNATFNDHYLDLDYDLSQVMFITTANNMHQIPLPLQDRLEIIQLSGYTEFEKLNIAKRHLVPKQLERNGLEKAKVEISDAALELLINRYTKESGVRSLEREVAAVCRKVAKEALAARNKGTAIEDFAFKVANTQVQKFLGPPKYKFGVTELNDEIGLVNGLAWTPYGGELLQTEVSVVPGKGKLTITGKLGDVMQESARAAMSYVRSRANDLGLDPQFYQEVDIHVHFPEGATPKDGPSAGVTMATALVSALCKLKVRHDVAMTGEITLRGRVLPIGGLKEKVLAARRGGIRTVIIPRENKKDIRDIPPQVRKGVEIVLVDHADEVLALALAHDGQLWKGRMAREMDAAAHPPLGGETAPPA